MLNAASLLRKTGEIVKISQGIDKDGTLGTLDWEAKYIQNKFQFAKKLCHQKGGLNIFFTSNRLNYIISWSVGSFLTRELILININ